MVTGTVPAAWAGVLAVMTPLLLTTTFVAEAPPIDTVAPAAKPLPVMVMAVPPEVEPEFGEIALIVGAAAAQAPTANKRTRARRHVCRNEDVSGRRERCRGAALREDSTRGP